MPYNAAAYGYNTLPSAAVIGAASAHKTISWAALQSGSYNEIKAHLAAGDCIVMEIPV